MENKSTLIRGLNYRVDDHEAKPGQCRILEDMYPSGLTDAPWWKPALRPSVVLANNKDLRIRSSFVWHRANLPSLLIILAAGDNTGVDSLYSIEMDTMGNVPKATIPVSLYDFLDIRLSREAVFAQAGDGLIVSVGTELRTEKMFWVRMIDNDAVCVDFNANIPFPQISLSLTETSEKNAALTFAHVYFAVRLAWELIDGTLLAVSSALVFDVPKGALKWPKLKFTSGTVAYADENWKRLVKGLVIFISPYVPDTTPNPAEYAVRESMFYRIAMLEGVFTGLPTYTFDEDWDTIITFERLESDVLISRKSMLAKTLYSYNKRIMYGDIEYLFVAPQRLDGRTENAVLPPSVTILKPLWLKVTAVTKPSSSTSTPLAPQTGILNQYRFWYKNTLDWRMPELSGSGLTYVKMVVERQISFTYKRLRAMEGFHAVFDHVRIVHENWHEIGSNAMIGADDALEFSDSLGGENNYFDFDFKKVILPSAGGEAEDVYDIEIAYRIKAVYTNGESEYVDVTTQSGDPALPAPNPRPVSNIELVVRGGDAVFNDLIIVKVGKIEALCGLKWSLPSEADTRLKIAAIHVQRKYSYKRRTSNYLEPPTFTDMLSQFDFVEVAVLPAAKTTFDDEIESPPSYLVKGEGYHSLTIQYKILVEYADSAIQPEETSPEWKGS